MSSDRCPYSAFVVIASSRSSRNVVVDFPSTAFAPLGLKRACLAMMILNHIYPASTPPPTPSLSPPLKITVQLVLPHKQARHSRQDTEPARDQKNPTDGLHVIPLHRSPQRGRQPGDLAQVLPDAVHDGVRVRHRAADAPVQPDAEQVLEGGRGDGEADDGAGGAEGEAGGRDDSLVFLLHGADEGDEGGDEDAAEAEAEEGHVEEWVEGRRVGVHGGGERGGEDDEGVGAFVEVIVVACRFHDEAGGERADGGAGGVGNEA